MAEITEQEKHQEQLNQLHTSLHEGSLDQVPELLAKLHPAEIASLLEALPVEDRSILWEQVSPEVNGDVLTQVNDSVRATLIKDMASHELVAATEGL
ncbi:MAG: magnesium transporter, partial [Gammaproteobacteria bacterium]|nr:magnesium transporter [Gammaproteobacteria bacterium]